MEQKDYFRFYVLREKELLDFPPENAGTLYVGNIINENIYWYDNYNEEWNRSLYLHSQIAQDPEFTQVQHFDNGYISSDDAIFYLTSRGKVTLPTTSDSELSM